MAEVLLETRGLSKHYRSTAANDAISIKIERGEIVGFIGQNGSGKTTLIRLLTGLAKPTSGTFSMSDSEGRTRIGAVVEAPGLFKWMTGSENLRYQALMCGREKADINEMLTQVGLDPGDRKKVKNYSLGMRQRLAIAVALISDPDFLILDEPTNGLDPQGIVDLRVFLRKLAAERGVTLLISSHILSELSQLATRFLIIDRGRIVESLTREELQAKETRHISFARAADPSAALERLAAMLGVDRKDVTAIGDNTLDLDMIEWAGTGVCVANGNERVKAKADLVIGACEDEGVAEYLESLFA